MAGNEAPRRFEFRDGSSHKFWVIELEATLHTVTYGRIGTAGQKKKKDFADNEKARKSYDKLIDQKVKKGYQEVVEQAAASPEEKKAAKAYAKLIEPFLKDILADPDDVGNYSIFGDWLTDQGDQRGELVGVQIALEQEGLSAADRKKLATQEKSLLKSHERDWLGSLAPYLIDQKEYESSWRGPKCYKYTFARGLLDTIETVEFSLQFGHALKNSVHSRTLRSLVIGATGYLEEPVMIDGKTYGEDDAGVQTLVGSKFDNLRKFVLGDEEDACHTEGNSVIELIKKMPRIEELQLAAHEVDTETLFRLKMPNLKTLIVHHIHQYPLEILAKNSSMKNLETLKMHPHAFEYDANVSAYLRFEHIQAIAKSKNLPSLQYLQFRLSDMGNEGIELIVNSGLLGRLKVLDLMHGCVTDDGVEMLCASPDLANLEMLNLDGNAITSAGIAALKKSKVKHTAKQQLDPEGIDEEREYLWYGDME